MPTLAPIEHLVVFQFVRPAHFGDDALDQWDHSRGDVVANVHDREFVAAEARDHVLRADAAEHAAADLLQQAIAHGMAERVVDRFEVIEIEQKDRERLGAAAGEHLLDLLAEHRAVRQIGQRIVPRHVGKARFGAAALGDVDGGEKNTGAAIVLHGACETSPHG